MIPETFHFLRPAWLAAIVPVALLAWSALYAATRASGWHRVVDAHLLRHLLLTDAGTTRRWPAALGALAGVAASVALAGPTWEEIPQPTFTTSEPTVVVLDLSPAMQVDDLAPSRLGRARLELHDLLARTKGAQVGLVLYTDEPFVATPLTDDGRLIEELIPTLESGLMPLRAPRADRALAQAKALLDQAGAASGRVLLVTSSLGDHTDVTLAVARELAASGHRLSVLGAGTEDGAPSRDARGRVVRDATGAPVLAKLDREGLEALAAAGGGRFSEIRADDADLAVVAAARTGSTLHAASPGSSARFDVWRDTGIWLVLVPLALAPLLFRRGLVAALAFAVLAAAPGHADASAWDDLWSRRDQQGQAALAAGDAASAAGLFEDPAWQAAATYENGTYDDAAAKYASLGGTENRYNQGNALAKSGQLEDAVARYDEVLNQEPAHADAKFNRDLVQRLLDEQRRQQQQQQSQDQQQGGGGEPQQQNADDGNDQQPDRQQGQEPNDEQRAQQPSGQDGQHEPQDGSQQAGAQQQNGNDPQGSGQEREQRQEREPSGGSAPQNDLAQQERDPNVQQANAGEAGRDEAARQDEALARALDQQLASEANENDDAQEAHPQRGSGSSTAAKPLTEQEQAREQALRNIPDDPAGLLRAKIRRQYAEKRYARKEVSPSW